MPAYISINLNKLPEGTFTISTNNIVTAMKDNPDYTGLPHPIGTVETTFNAYKALSKERYMMSPKDTYDRNELRTSLMKMLSENGRFVIALYPNDREKQIATNYPPVKTPDTSGEPEKPTNVKATDTGHSGEAKLQWKGSTIAKGYTVKYRIKDAGAEWQYLTAEKTRDFIIKGLKSGEVHEFWVMAIGTKRDSGYGGPAELRIP